jgi:hypothetical protein
MEDEEECIREVLSSSNLEITEGCSHMSGNIDSYVALSLDNTSVDTVKLYPFYSDAGDYEFWDKVGQILGNLMELQMINIHFLPYTESESDEEDDDYDDDSEESPSPDWETLTRSLQYLRHKVKLCLPPGVCITDVEQTQGLARAIHGHPMISAFHFQAVFTFGNLGLFCSALAALPSLDRVTLDLQEPETEDQRVLVNPESFTSLLRAPALRFVKFFDFYFTNALCHATAYVLEEGSSVTDITFHSGCSFPDGGGAIIANGLKRNKAVTDVKFLGHFDEPFFNTLAAVLLCNSTLQNLIVRAENYAPNHARGRWVSAILLSALGMNTTLKSLSVSIIDTFGDTLCAAISSGLAKNSSLEELSLYEIIPSDDGGAVFARNALSFLRTNSTLKSLTVSFVRAPNEYVSAFLLEAVKMLENTFLESLKISSFGRGIAVEEFLALISALQLNTTLKTLDLQCYWFENHSVTVDEVSQLVSILRKNYGLEHIVPKIPGADAGTVKAILRLNKAGRRYLIKDGSSVSKGVDVLSAVNDEIDCVFFHLLENPGLCDRSAAETAETTTGRQRSGANLDKTSSTGKRERAQSQAGKESHRRLA